MSAMRLLTAEPLARHTTFRVGGPADVLQIESGEELEQLALAGRLPTDVGLLLGGGSNVLISDAGLRSTVLILRARSTEPPPMRADPDGIVWLDRSEEHTSELQSLMRNSYAVFCLKKNIQTNKKTTNR